jgi:hypothetical protein
MERRGGCPLLCVRDGSPVRNVSQGKCDSFRVKTAEGRGKHCYVLSNQTSNIPKSELKEREKRLDHLQW